ncbi:MAG: methyltransferase domain-containing protein [Oceanicoccus sp.]|uniref:putative RNA methyltransferase n=1 Tax=Oceanicoccus sp. TaxID=2691044 RepID=UPI002624E02A|nr:methyltransferase domain-containing protein [Oceanicoccus sp.]MCP3909035.1 methyltransferase domain-containing protein [Oceanicoccus sp.]
MQIICPLCQLPLIKEQINSKQGRWYCDNNHSFDIAKQGYTNLLPVQNKKSRSPGDDAEMVASRQRFLAKELYGPVATSLNGLVSDYVKAQALNQVTVIDAGCGEGYYTNKIQQGLIDYPGDSEIVGVDISKHAVLAAARQHKTIQWFVAKSQAIPVAEHCADILVSLFSPIASEEFQRCLKSNGLLIIASTGKQHLLELREIIYPQVKEEAFNPQTALDTCFKPLNSTRICLPIELGDNSTIQDLLAMTPHFWRASPERKQLLADIDHLSVTIDIQLHCFINTGK